ncbi:unnamed protein product [Parajaminaea phylloscopi]
MSERKVLTKYYPPDFDPSKVPRRKIPKDTQQVVRLMAPYTMRCLSCGEFIYKGRKFNARKETVQGEDYYGIKIFRFYIKCTRCSAEITFKTDPKNTDYQAEHGASRNFYPTKDDREPAGEDDDPLAHFVEEEKRKELEASGQSDSAKRIMAEEGADPMATLEARQAESKREMEVLDALQDIRTRNARLDRVSAGTVIDRLAQKRAGDAAQRATLDPEQLERQKAEEDDEALVRKYFSRAEDLGGPEEARELRESLSGGGAPAADEQAEPEVSHNGQAIETTGAETSTATHTSGKPSGVSVKRAYGDGIAGAADDEPAATSLLSDRARSLLGAGSVATAVPPPKRKKKGPNSLGIVRKKT